MTLHARILNRDVPLMDLKISILQNKIGKIQCTVPLAPFVGAGVSEYVTRKGLRYEDIAIYSDDTLIRSGYIKEARPAKKGDVGGFIKIVAEDELGKLSLLWSKPDAHYQDILVTAIVSDLLTLTSDWELGDTTSMDDVTATTTVNVRSKDRLWAQLVEAVESIPLCFIRYGGVNPANGNHKLNIGLFGEQDDGIFLDTTNITKEIKVKRSPNEVIQKMRAKGGKAGDIIIKLDGTQTEKTGFTVAIDVGTNEYAITNTSLTKGVSVSRTFREIRTQNETPPLASELIEVRQSLYDKAVREMENSQEFETLNVGCSLNAIPLIGRDMKIRSIAAEQTYDTLTEKITYTNIRNLDGFYRVTKIQLKWKKPAGAGEIEDVWTTESIDAFDMTLELTDGLDLSDYDDANFLAKRLENHEDDEPYGAGIGLGGTYLIEVQHTGVATDCDVGGVDGKKFQFDFPVEISDTINSITYRVITPIPSNALFNVHTEPNLGTEQPLILCVTGANNTDWDTGDDITVLVQYTFHT